MEVKSGRLLADNNAKTRALREAVEMACGSVSDADRDTLCTRVGVALASCDTTFTLACVLLLSVRDRAASGHL